VTSLTTSRNPPFFDAVHAELKFVRYLPDYLRRARPKKRKPT
jgi:hypothetical protein